MRWDELELETLAVRAGTHRSQFNEHSEALYLTSSFVFKDAAEAAARFSGEDPGMVYSRYTNPTVSAFQERLAALEGAECCIATASGMSAILGCVMALMKAGDPYRFVAQHFRRDRAVVRHHDEALRRRHHVRAGDRRRRMGTGDAAEHALVVPGNALQSADRDFRRGSIGRRGAPTWRAAGGGQLLLHARRCNGRSNSGADIVIHSATKYLDGQGRVLGGAVLGRRELILDGMTAFLRSCGPTLSPFNAWVILKGLETLGLRMQAHSRAALELAQWLEAHPKVERVYYPGLSSHPQHALAMRQQKSGGGIVSFVVKGGREAAWKVVDSTQLISITANLGDTKTTITHPASTTHGRIAPEARKAAGIGEGLLRIAVGLEAVSDVKADLARGLAKV